MKSKSLFCYFEEITQVLGQTITQDLVLTITQVLVVIPMNFTETP